MDALLPGSAARSVSIRSRSALFSAGFFAYLGNSTRAIPVTTRPGQNKNRSNRWLGHKDVSRSDRATDRRMPGSRARADPDPPGHPHSLAAQMLWRERQVSRATRACMPAIFRHSVACPLASKRTPCHRVRPRSPRQATGQFRSTDPRGRPCALRSASPSLNKRDSQAAPARVRTGIRTASSTKRISGISLEPMQTSA
jgi:hypothetical protein